MQSAGGAAVEIALAVYFHPIRSARSIAAGFGEESTVGERAVGRDIIDANQAFRRVIDV